MWTDFATGRVFLVHVFTLDTCLALFAARFVLVLAGHAGKAQGRGGFAHIVPCWTCCAARTVGDPLFLVVLAF